MDFDQGMAPITKNSDRREAQLEGMIPIAKNIEVVDVFDNPCEPTYLKRAKGLVKHGRAVFVHATKIRLIDSPYLDMEGLSVTDQNLETTEKGIFEPKVTEAYLLKKIDEISQDNVLVHDALNKLGMMQSNLSNDGTGLGIAEAIGNIVTSHEQTNQKILDFYMKLYEDCRK